MNIGIPKELRPFEYRVGLIPGWRGNPLPAWAYRFRGA